MFVVSCWGLKKSQPYWHKQQFVCTALSCSRDSWSSYFSCVSRRLVTCCNYLSLLSPKLLNNPTRVTSIQRVVSAFHWPQAFQTTLKSFKQHTSRNKTILLSFYFSTFASVCSQPQQAFFRNEITGVLKSLNQRSYFHSKPHTKPQTWAMWASDDQNLHAEWLSGKCSRQFPSVIRLEWSCLFAGDTLNLLFPPD